jgi:hypothetical protein
VDLLEQVAVPVEEGAVDCCGAGDAGDADLGAVAGGLVDRGDDPPAAACWEAPVNGEHKITGSHRQRAALIYQ